MENRTARPTPSISISGRAGPLNGKKDPTASSYSSAAYTQQKPSSAPSWGHQPNTPAWTHQPAVPIQSPGLGSLSGPTSMVGDDFGKSWNSPAPSSSCVSGIGIVNNKNPNLFGDLLGAAIGQNKSSNYASLKSSANSKPSVGMSSASKASTSDAFGDFQNAIKWFSWAVILLEKASDDEGTMEVLTSRASCYKEVGEYKKAVADCTKYNALLYESMEKYKLGAEDLRTVMNIDPVIELHGAPFIA
ncbi:tetratricopeptide repeat protein [Striga asiatica]|uniref:Tetratricopeptide repeat protein n=1 Tax=Striga asiatica TaxID=4170 RepID=A0A5A7P4M5_STRAF|nr:tetratricopeptide repeat protein [Striga asiatica]